MILYSSALSSVSICCFVYCSGMNAEWPFKLQRLLSCLYVLLLGYIGQKRLVTEVALQPRGSGLRI